MLKSFGGLPQFVSAGKVACERQARDVSIETCAECGLLDKIVVRDQHQLVYCERDDDRTLSILTYPR